MAYLLQKERVEHVRLRALAQVMMAKEKGKEAFDEYMQVAFPWIEKQKKQDVADHIRVLMHEVKNGALSITPMGQTNKMKSRLRTKVVERQEASPRKYSEAFYKKLGRIIPV